ncbi:MAG TPA: hypothetical protein VG934_02555 [Candidatus Paceibacterota bacterium]|nr:hypothetical protein [Candidatus Paceibacterota bacterium]
MSVETDTKILIDLLDPPRTISHNEARTLIREHIPPRDIRRLRYKLETIKNDPVALEHARERGPEWLTSKDGRQWLGEQARQHVH